MSEWIDVRDHLPPPGVMVLVAELDSLRSSGRDKRLPQITTLAVRSGNHVGTDAWEVVENCGGYECEPDECSPTHWMPLPKRPKRTIRAGEMMVKEHETVLVKPSSMELPDATKAFGRAEKEIEELLGVFAFEKDDLEISFFRESTTPKPLTLLESQNLRYVDGRLRRVPPPDSVRLAVTVKVVAKRDIFEKEAPDA